MGRCAQARQTALSTSWAAEQQEARVEAVRAVGHRVLLAHGHGTTHRLLLLRPHRRGSVALVALDAEQLARGAAAVVEHRPRAASPQHVRVGQEEVELRACAEEREQPPRHRAHQPAVAVVVPAHGALPCRPATRLALRQHRLQAKVHRVVLQSRLPQQRPDGPIEGHNHKLCQPQGTQPSTPVEQEGLIAAVHHRGDQSATAHVGAHD